MECVVAVVIIAIAIDSFPRLFKVIYYTTIGRSDLMHCNACKRVIDSRVFFSYGGFLDHHCFDLLNNCGLCKQWFCKDCTKFQWDNVHGRICGKCNKPN
jgi:hypothetical protein